MALLSGIAVPGLKDRCSVTQALADRPLIGAVPSAGLMQAMFE
jgi:hypothetical protein